MTDKMHAGRVLFALARYFNWWEMKLVTEFEIDGLREDLVVVSRAGYATVIEIKVSRADWQADKFKSRWPSKRVARFFYAVPHELYLGGVPAHVPEFAGLLSVRAHGLGFDNVREERSARQLKAEKLSDEQLRRIDRAFYYRFWRAHMDREQARLIDRPKAAQMHSRAASA